MHVLTVADAPPANDAPAAPRLPRRTGTVAMLVLATFLPRAVAAWRWDVIWGDTLHYIHASLALERGDLQNGFAEFGLNIYPLMLIPLRHLGVDWQITGKWFSVLVATLTVVPIWAWVRRMFDDRTAVLACLVYALHGKLIAISPLIIRDSTFWLLLALSLCLLWRAIDELRLSCYVAAGAAMTLAIYTRTEGWLLLIPLLGWTACRWRRVRRWTAPSLSLAGGAAVSTARPAGRAPAPQAPPARFRTRRRLALGALICLAVLPASLAVVNMTWLRDQPRWQMLRADHWRIILNWWETVDAEKPTSAHADVAPAPSKAMPHAEQMQDATVPETGPSTSPSMAPPARFSNAAPLPPPPSIVLSSAAPVERSAPGWLLTFKLLERAAKGFTWVGCVLLLTGIGAAWRQFLRPEHLTLLAMNVLLLIVSGIRYRSAGLDLRYFMPMVIVGLPWMALGGQALVNGLLRIRPFSLRERVRVGSGQDVHGDAPLEGNSASLVAPLAMGAGRHTLSGSQRAVAGVAVAVLIACSLADAPLSAAAFMRRHAALGTWIRDNAPAAPALAGNIDTGDLSLDAYYARGRCVGVFAPRDCLLVPPPGVLAKREADFLVLWNSDDLKRDQLDLIAQRLAVYYGYRRVPPRQLPAGDNEVMLFVKQ